MKQEVFWKNPGYKRKASLKGDISCDYLIVGGGITGVMAAYFLHRRGVKNIILIERNRIGSGATGKAAGIYVPVPEKWYMDHYTRYLGIKKTAAYWISHLAAFHTLKHLIVKNSIDCDMDYEPMFCLESPYISVHEVLKEYKALKWFRFFKVKLLMKGSLEKEVHSNMFTKGFKLWKSLSVNPLKLVQNISVMLEKNGVAFYENTLLVKRKGNVAYTPEGKISFNKIINAVDSDTKSPGMEAIKTSIAVSEQLPYKVIKKVVPHERIMFWDVRKKSYHYGKITKDNRILVGYGDTLAKKHDSGKVEKNHINEIKRFIERMLPENIVNLEYAWSGVYGHKKGILPLVKIGDNEATIAACESQITSVMLADYVSRKMNSKEHLLDNVFMA